MKQVYVEPLSIIPIKSKHENKSDKDVVKLKLRRDPTSSSSDLYDFKRDCFGNSEPKEFLLFL